MDREAKADCGGRKRCVVCRGWFRAHHSAVETQLVCTGSQKCRTGLRRRQARKRREVNLGEFRDRDRRRQQDHRRQKRASEQARDGAESRAGRSRASLSREAVDSGEVLLKIWDKERRVEARVSRARLGEELGRLAALFQGFSSLGVGQSVGGE